MVTIQCSKCKIHKNPVNFHHDKSRKNGRAVRCKICAREDGAIIRLQPAYNSYDNVKKKIDVKSHDAWEWYGGRGIKYDKETFRTYKAFWETYGHLYEEAVVKYPGEKLTIDRIDNDGDYIYGNIRFVPRIINSNNTSRNIYIKYRGKTQTIAMWAREFNLPYHTFQSRYKQQWPMYLIESTPCDNILSRCITKLINTHKKELTNG